MPSGIVFSLTEPLGKQNSVLKYQSATIQPENHRIFQQLSVCLYLLHMYEIVVVSELLSRGQPRHDYTKQTNLDHSERLLLDLPVQYYSLGAENHCDT